jgi:membrane protein DedA with SNARE-associated domain
METWIAGLAEHGYSILFLIVFLEAIGIPIPAALALLVGGAACARGALHPAIALPGALATMLCADMLMFLLGRRTGWGLLALLCRLSLNPESCILRSADAFHRRGRMLLVIAKFIPGINTMAPPLAGSMNMRFFQFLRLDFCGASLYISAYFIAGYIFSDILGSLMRGYQTMGSVLVSILIVGGVFYLAFHVRMYIKSRALRTVPTVSPAEALRDLADGKAIIYDVRSHGYYDRKAVRIQGSRRLDPNGLHLCHLGDLPAGQQVYLYCT